MEFVVNENIKIWQKYDPIELYCYPATDDILVALFENQTRIFIKDRWFDVISLSRMVRSKSKSDGCYHFITRHKNSFYRRVRVGNRGDRLICDDLTNLGNVNSVGILAKLELEYL